MTVGIVSLTEDRATIIAGANGDGVPDLTGGTDLKGGNSVPTNHLLLIPRSDGRGLYITNKSKKA